MSFFCHKECITYHINTHSSHYYSLCFCSRRGKLRTLSKTPVNSDKSYSNQNSYLKTNFPANLFLDFTEISLNSDVKRHQARESTVIP